MKQIIILVLGSGLLAVSGCTKEKTREDVIDFPAVETSFSEEARVREITFGSTNSWNLYFEKGGDWCSVTPESGRAGNSTIQVNIPANTTYDEREAVITILSGNTRHTFRFVQAENTGVLVPVTEHRLSMEGGTVAVDILQNRSYSVTIPEQYRSWISRLPAERALSADHLRFSIAANTDPSFYARSGEIHIQVGEERKVVRVVQVAGGFGYVRLDSPNTLAGKFTEEEAAKIKRLVIAGQMGEGDFLSLKKLMPDIVLVDLSQTSLEVLPDYALSQETGYESYLWHLEEVILPSALKSIGYMALSAPLLKRVNIPAGVTEIGERAFMFSALERVDIPAGVRKIGSRTFGSCLRLREVHLPENLEEIAAEAFSHSPQLDKIVIPEMVERIGNNSFLECTGLKEVVFEGNDLQFIGAGAFSTTGLTGIEFPQGLLEISDWAFSQCPHLTELDIPAQVRRIGSAAFSRTGLVSVRFRGSIEKFGISVFGDCYNLKDILLPEDITAIPDYTFSGCRSLEEIRIPPTVRSIGSEAFWDCYALRTLTMLPEVPPVLGLKVFDYVPEGFRIEVPAASLDAYKAAPTWNTFTNYTGF